MAKIVTYPIDRRMFDLKTAARKAVWVIIYLAALVPAGLVTSYLSDKNLLPALIASTVFLSILTLLIVKDLRFLSALAFASLVLFILATPELVGNQAGGEFTNRTDEKIALLVLPFQISFVIANSFFWAATKTGFKRLAALFLISISVLVLLAFGNTPPNFYQNFIYTRASVLVLSAFGVFLLFRRKWLWGILGILSVIGVLFLSAAMFSEKVYLLEEAEQTEVLGATTPIAKEMLDYYNREDFDNFCARCAPALRKMLEENPLDDNREFYGPYTSLGAPTMIVSKGGRYYVEYPVKFQKEKEQMYLTLVMESIPSAPSVYGFSFSKSPGGR